MNIILYLGVFWGFIKRPAPVLMVCFALNDLTAKMISLSLVQNYIKVKSYKIPIPYCSIRRNDFIN